jgi:hypothetical protein
MARRSRSTQRDPSWITPGVAAKLWGLSRSGVHHWIDLGLLDCFRQDVEGGPYLARRRDVLAAKVLLPDDLQAKGVLAELLARALQRGIVVFGSGPHAGRLSLDDVERVRALERAEAKAREPPKRFQSGFVPKPLVALRQELHAWILRGANPAEAPDWHFDVPDPPKVVPPPGVYRYTPHRLKRGGEPGERWVRRSAGSEVVGGALVVHEEDDHFATLRDGQEMPAEWVESNELYQLVERWQRREWWVRQRRLRR